MQCVTVQIDESIVKEVQNLASVAKEPQQERERAAEELVNTFKRLAKPMGKRDWTRVDLYDRPGLL